MTLNTHNSYCNYHILTAVGRSLPTVTDVKRHRMKDKIVDILSRCCIPMGKICDNVTGIYLRINFVYWRCYDRTKSIYCTPAGYM